MVARSLLIGLLLASGAGAAAPEGEPDPPRLPVGIFLASIEEGARIFTPVRLLPFDHPEAFGHEFPNALRLYATEFEALVLLARHAGLDLAVTLTRYPGLPEPGSWPFSPFAPPPLAELGRAVVVWRHTSDAPLSGLRAVGYLGRTPVVFLVDTRGLSLADRGMTRATAMGLDITRAAFLAALGEVAARLPDEEATIVVFRPE